MEHPVLLSTLVASASVEPVGQLDAITSLMPCLGGTSVECGVGMGPRV